VFGLMAAGVAFYGLLACSPQSRLSLALGAFGGTEPVIVDQLSVCG